MKIVIAFITCQDLEFLGRRGPQSALIAQDRSAVSSFNLIWIFLFIHVTFHATDVAEITNCSEIWCGEEQIQEIKLTRVSFFS